MYFTPENHLKLIWNELVRKLSYFVTKKVHLVTLLRRKIINGKTFITRRVKKYSVTIINVNYFVPNEF